jgi:hypothetical protein
MISIEDFTEFREGVTIAEDGLIDRCPLCGRNGLCRQRADGTIRFVHIESWRMFADGLRVEPEDSCLLPARHVA